MFRFDDFDCVSWFETVFDVGGRSDARRLAHLKKLPHVGICRNGSFVCLPEITKPAIGECASTFPVDLAFAVLELGGTTVTHVS